MESGHFFETETFAKTHGSWHKTSQAIWD